MSTETRHHKLDFSGLSLEKAGTPEWDRVRAEMMEVVVNEQGWFEAVYDGVAPELREALFDRSLKELFELPVDVKMRNTSNKANHGYIGQFPGMDYEALSVADVHLVESTRSFTELINGRLRAQLHRVMVGGEDTRYSAILGSLPKDDVMVEVPEELVDEEHPLMYKPFNYPSFVNFTYSEEGAKSNDTLKAYCGVQQDDQVGA
ncbi:hypothetical protein GW17_00057390 [Ensete ventricosum]|nr:hypothetical protein GW17_00057390 [Ensete ventricosum]